MRAFPLAIAIVVGLVGVTAAQQNVHVPLITTKTDGVKITLRDGTIATAGPAGQVYEVFDQKADQVEVKTWYGASGWIDLKDVNLWKNPIQDFTARIQKDPLDAGAFADRGVAWQVAKDRASRKFRASQAALSGYLKAPTVMDAHESAGPLDWLTMPIKSAAAATVESMRLVVEIGNAKVAKDRLVGEVGGLVDPDLKDFAESLRLDPRQADVYRLSGLAWFSKAKEALDKSNSTAVDDTLIGHFDNAIGEFDRALRIDPKLASAYFARAETELARGKAHLAAAKAAMPMPAPVVVFFFPLVDGSLTGGLNVSINFGFISTPVPKAPPAAQSDKKPAPAEDMDTQTKLLVKLNRAFAAADADLAAAKENWTQLRTELAKATMPFYDQAQKNFIQANNEYEEAKKAWKAARQRVFDVTDTLAVLTKKAGDTKKTACDAKTKASANADAAADRQKVPLENAKIYLQDAIRDYYETLRQEPGATVALDQRGEAQRSLDEVRALLAKLEKR